MTDPSTDPSANPSTDPSLDQSKDPSKNAATGADHSSDTWSVGQSLDVDSLFKEWSQEDELSEDELEPKRRFSVGRSPAMLFVITLISAGLSYFSYPMIGALINADEYESCDRDVTFQHHQKCEMDTYVASSYIVAVGRAHSPNDPDEWRRYDGLSYVVQLHLNRDSVKFLSQDDAKPQVMSEGEVYAIVPAHRRSVAELYRSQGDLAGFKLTAQDDLNRGLIVDPGIDEGYRHLERELRVNLDIPYTEKLLFLDLTYNPWNQVTKIMIAVLAPLIMLMSLLALRNEVKRRRVVQALDEADEAWLREFERAGESFNDESSSEA